MNKIKFLKLMSMHKHIFIIFGILLIMACRCGSNSDSLLKPTTEDEIESATPVTETNNSCDVIFLNEVGGCKKYNLRSESSYSYWKLIKEGEYLIAIDNNGKTYHLHAQCTNCNRYMDTATIDELPDCKLTSNENSALSFECPNNCKFALTGAIFDHPCDGQPSDDL